MRVRTSSKFCNAHLLQLRNVSTNPALVIFEISSACNPNPVSRPHPRITLVNNGNLELRWVNMSTADTGRYSCHVENCTRELDVSDPTQLVVIEPPTYVNITPAGDITAKDGDAISLNIKCHANVGAPNGNLTLMRLTKSGNKELDVSREATGNTMTGTHVSTEIANSSAHDDLFQCKAFSDLDQSKSVVSQTKRLIIVYRPSKLQVTSTSSPPSNIVTVSDALTNVSVPNGAIGLVICKGESYPLAAMYGVVSSGDSKVVRILNGTGKVEIHLEQTTAYAKLEVQCSSKYASTAYPELDQTISTVIAIEIAGNLKPTTSAKPNEVQSEDESWIWIVIGVLCGLLVIALISLSYMCFKLKKSRSKNKNLPVPFNASDDQHGPNLHGERPNPNDPNQLADNQHHPQLHADGQYCEDKV